MRKRYGQHGIGLLELMLSLTVVALLLVIATRYYGTVRSNYRVHEGLGMIYAVYSASESWLQNNNSIPANPIQSFINNGSLPSDFTGSTINPWGGSITLAGANQTITIRMTNAPAADCNNLKEKLLKKLGTTIVTPPPTCTNNSLSVTLNLTPS
jgi:Tfp pilus assembly protein PilE